MARGGKKTSANAGRSAAKPAGAADEIPGRAAKRPLWAYVLLAVIFAGWVAFLVFCRITGAP
jgi:hypothetical protein